MEILTRVEGRGHCKELQVDGKVVSWLTIIDQQMRIGSAQVRMGGIAGVGTSNDQRMKGYSRKVLENSVEYMQSEGFDISGLFGIPNFYHKYGFAVCLPSPSFSMTTRNAEAAKDDVKGFGVRDYSDTDLDSLIDLYNCSNQMRTGAIVRDKSYFTGIKKGSDWFRPVTMFVVEDGSGRFVGYAAMDKVDDAAVVTEVAATDAKSYSTFLYEFAKRAIDRRCGEISFRLPIDDPFAEFLHRYNCNMTVDYPKCANGMMRIINQRNLFVKLQNELSRRLSNSALHNYSGRVGIRTDLGDTVLNIDSGKVSVVNDQSPDVSIEMPQHTLMQVLVGYRSVRDAMSLDDVHIDENAVAVANALFPPDYPYIWEADHF